VFVCVQYDRVRAKINETDAMIRHYDIIVNMPYNNNNNMTMSLKFSQYQCLHVFTLFIYVDDDTAVSMP